MDATQVLQYYREHSAFTDPGKYAALYEELPRDVPGLARVVQGLLIPPYVALLRNQFHVDPEEIGNEPFGPFGPRRKEFLLWMGHGAGGFMRGSDCFYEHLPRLRAWAMELLWENGYAEPLPEDAFVFYMHQGYLFYFVCVGESDDPPVYFYSEAMETPAFIIEHPNLADFLNYQIEVEVHYREDYVARLARAEKNNPKLAKEMKDRARLRGDDF